MIIFVIFIITWIRNVSNNICIIIMITNDNVLNCHYSSYFISNHIFSMCTYVLTGPIEYLQWSSAPLSLSLAMPYIVTQLVDTVEIHDICSLNIIQKIIFNSPIISIFSLFRKFSEDNENNENNENNIDDNGNGNGDQGRFISGQNSHNNVIINNKNNNNPDENEKSKYQRSSVSTGINGSDRIIDLPHIFVCTVGRNNDQLYVLRMRSILNQVRTYIHHPL